MGEKKYAKQFQVDGETIYLKDERAREGLEGLESKVERLEMNLLQMAAALGDAGQTGLQGVIVETFADSNGVTLHSGIHDSGGKCVYA